MINDTPLPLPADFDTAAYAHHWVALAGAQVAGVGETGPAALRLARRNWPKQKQFTLHYVEPAGGEPLTIPPLLERLWPFIAQYDQPIYVVGGAVRDMIHGRASHDIDLVVTAEAIQCGFKMGDFLGLPAYVLDRERDVARIVVADENTTIDIAAQRGATLTDDLRDRDLTINSMALPTAARTRASVVDVVGGRDDLAHGIVRQTSATSLLNDPIRGLRAVRMALKMGFELDPATAANIPLSLAQCHTTSAERLRDELNNLLLVDPAGTVRWLHQLGSLAFILPAVAGTVGVAQSDPHHEDVYDHTCSVLAWLMQVEAAVDGHPCQPPAMAAWLAPWQSQLQAHLKRTAAGGVSGRLLLRWAALLHDVGKPATQTVDPNGRIRFITHEHVGAHMARDLLNALRFSAEATTHTARIVDGHMRPLLMANDPHPPTLRTIYRFLRQYDSAGVDVALLSLADHLATYDGTGETAAWEQLGAVIGQLLGHYFDHYEETVRPVPLLGGRDLMRALHLKGGPEIGRLLRLLEEAQAAGEIATAEEALALAQQAHAAGPAPE